MKIIYLLGRGRSGSTLISHVLGSQKDILNVGELKISGNIIAERIKRAAGVQMV